MEFWFERKALKGDPVPDELDFMGSCLYEAFRSLYAMYKDGQITKRSAAIEKKKIVDKYITMKSKADFLSRESLALSERISSASETYKNNPTIENADRMYAAFYRLPDDWRG